jgi:hypothetical protein
MYLMDGHTNFCKVFIDITQVAVLIDTANAQNAPDDPAKWTIDFCGYRYGSRDKSLIWDTFATILTLRICCSCATAQVRCLDSGCSIASGSFTISGSK